MNEIFSLQDVCAGYPQKFAERQEDWEGTAEASAVAVLHNVNFSLREGEKIGLFGPNGCGKTTFFRCITGLVQPMSGSIRLAGRPCTTEQDFTRLRQQVGFVLQNADDQLFFPTVREDVAFGPCNRGLSTAEAYQCAASSLEQLGISGLADRLVHQLSAGEKRLVALAGILAMQPKALLLDEPTTGLDPAATRRVVDVLNSLSCARITVSHDWDFVQAVSDTFYTIAAGALVPLEASCVHSHTHSHPLGSIRHHHGFQG